MIQPKIPMTSAEMAQLWTAYINDSAAACMLGYFLNTAEDIELKPLIEKTLTMSKRNLEQLRVFFSQDHIPIPQGFTEADVNVKAKKLFTDPLILQFIKNMGTLGMSAYSLAITNCARKDVREYFSERQQETTRYHNEATDLLLAKGLYVRTPSIPFPEQVEFVQKESFLNGFFGDRRPLNAVEISQVFFSLITNALGKAMMIAFSQTAQDKEVSEFIVRGRDMAAKHVEVFSSQLHDELLPAPTTWDAYITDSTEPPFSDKLMLFQTTFLIATGIANYGMSIAMCARHDLGAVYSRLLVECAAYAEDGAKLMIEREWLEKVPGAVDRDALVTK